MNVPLLPIAITIEKRPLHAVRFRIRDAMVLVALAAIGLFLARLGPMADAYRGRASFYLQKMRENQYLVNLSKESLVALEMDAETWKRAADTTLDPAAASKSRREAAKLEPRMAMARAAVSHWEKRADYHSRMSERYGFAARYPWIPLLPDPSEP